MPLPTPPAGRPQRLPARARWAVALLAAAAAALLVAVSAWWWPGAAWAAPFAAALAVWGALSWLPAPAPVVAPRAPLPSGDSSLREPQTGMFHRPAFLALAERDWVRAGRYGGAVSLLLIEVDRLRAMTDRAGPAVADALLGGLGRQVLGSLRAADLLARFDDAQLAVFLPHADPTGALDVADRIREGVEQLRLPGLPDSARFSASIGVAVLRPLHQPLSALVGDAQQALQIARQAGGNCVRMAPADRPPADGGSGRWVGGDTTRPGRRDA